MKCNCMALANIIVVFDTMFLSLANSSSCRLVVCKTWNMEWNGMWNGMEFRMEWSVELIRNPMMYILLS